MELLKFIEYDYSATRFVEISEELAQEKGIAKVDMVKVSSKRGYIKAVAVVTKRVKPLEDSW